MLEELQNLNLFPVTAGEIVVNLVIALICSITISLIYRRTYRGPGYSVSFANSIILLSMITGIIIMVIGNSLARAFGLVGAMSIIRFRTAVKETQDIVFIFFSLAVGMAAGAGYHKIAVVGTIFVSAVLLVLARSGLTVPGHKEYLLQFAYTGNGDVKAPYLPIFRKHCRKFKVINVRSADENETLEISYYVKLHDEKQSNNLVSDLRRTECIHSINLYFDEERI